jgi:Na+-driven multidrug efflux pump
MTTPHQITASRPLWQAYLIFLGPMMLGNILQALSGTINNVYLGQMIGVQALAAVSAFFPILVFFISFVIGLGAGAAVLIGQAHGAREPEKVKAIAGTTLTATVVAGLVVSIFGVTFVGRSSGSSARRPISWPMLPTTPASCWRRCRSSSSSFSRHR